MCYTGLRGEEMISEKATATINGVEFEFTDVEMEVVRHYGKSSFTLEYLNHREHRKLRTPRLSRHFKEVVVPWDVLKVKNKLKRG